MLMTQIRLKRPEAEDSIRIVNLITWVESDKRLKKGVKVTLKGDDRVWTIDEVYGEAELSQIDHRGWDNNNYDKHKGLGI